MRIADRKIDTKGISTKLSDERAFKITFRIQRQLMTFGREKSASTYFG